MTTQESNTISYAKAIAIILMVLGHSSVPNVWIVSIIYTFHIPLFLLLSGYCFKSRYLDDAWTFFCRKFVGIYVPFVEASLVFLVLHNVFYYLHIYDGNYGYGEWTSHVYTIKEILIHAKHVVLGMRTEEDLLGGFWFLKELFWGNIIFYILFRLCCRDWLTILLSLVLAHLLNYTQWSIPILEINWLTFYSAAFIGAGFCMNKYKVYWCQKWLWVPCLFLFASGIILNSYYQGMPSQHIESLFLYYLSSIGATMLIYCFVDGICANTPPREPSSQIRRRSHTKYTYLAFPRFQVSFAANSEYL